MKALSVKQPYAQVIVEGIKDIENRTYRTHFRGTVYIHASSIWHDRVKTHECYTREQCAAIVKHNKGLIDFPRYADPRSPNPLPLGAIIGQVDIIDCVIGHKSIWAEKNQIIRPELADYIKSGLPQEWEEYNTAYYKWQDSKPIWNWVLANPIEYSKPILNIKGKLGLWNHIPDPCPHLNINRSDNLDECLDCGAKNY